VSAQRYASPVAQEKMRQNLCPECGCKPETHSDDTRFWVPRICDLTRTGVEDRIAQFRADEQASR
jgi:hypothetical protein